MSLIRVLIVDDSALARQLLTEILGKAQGIEVVGTAGDPFVAWEKVQRLQPDVMTLDVEMPRMDGLTFLERLMRLRPMPVIMVSSLTERSCETTLRALELGAIDYVTKPRIDISRGTAALGEEIVRKVLLAARARVRPRPTGARPEPMPQPLPAPQRRAGLPSATHKVIAIGASTGGTEALREILVALPPDAPGVVVVQHMPEGFTRSFAQRLDGLCRVRVAEAQSGDRVLPGHVLIARGNHHLAVVRRGAEVSVRVFQAEPVNRHRPSVDVLLSSCAEQLGHNAVGAVLTGMGDDGARGLLAMREAGARTLAQDEASCVVFGMPREAIKRGGAEEVCPLGRIAERLLGWAA